MGLVGEDSLRRRCIIKDISRHGYIPDIAPIADGVDGKAYNIKPTPRRKHCGGPFRGKVHSPTDVEGVMNKDGKLISVLKRSEIEKLIDDNVVTGGMIPKVTCCTDD